MTPEQRQEEISKAYVHAVAAACGCAVGTWSQDYGDIDATIGVAVTVGQGTLARPKIDLQLKVTTRQRLVHEEFVSRNRAVPATGVTRVALPAESLQGLDAVAEAMRHRAQATGFDVGGYVTRLDRNHEAMEGDVVLVPRDGTVELRQVQVHLDPEAYAKAVQPHPAGSPVRVVGMLSKTGRRWSLSDATGFDLAADADVELALLSHE